MISLPLTGDYCMNSKYLDIPGGILCVKQGYGVFDVQCRVALLQNSKVVLLVSCIKDH